ncbi:MAG: hypothetical protein RRZ42_00670, partial [Oscillospiraceae bacterium]
KQIVFYHEQCSISITFSFGIAQYISDELSPRAVEIPRSKQLTPALVDFSNIRHHSHSLLNKKAEPKSL